MARGFWAGIALLIQFCHAHDVCLTELKQHQHIKGVPSWLLYAIALTESGREINGRVVPWPWTINVQGKGYFYPTKQAAIEAVRKFQRRGITCIDVGCMQINLKFHPNAFANLEKAFDPRANIHYAAQFLKELKGRHSRWKKAVAHYHSAMPHHGAAYLQKVMRHWKPLRTMFEKFQKQNATLEPTLRIQRISAVNMADNEYLPDRVSSRDNTIQVNVQIPNQPSMENNANPMHAQVAQTANTQDTVASTPPRSTGQFMTFPDRNNGQIATVPAIARHPEPTSRRIRATFVPSANLIMQSKNPPTAAVPLPKVASIQLRQISAVNTANGSLEVPTAKFIKLR